MNLAEVQRIVLLIFLGVLVYLLIQAWNTDYGMANRIVEDQRAPMVEQDQRLEEVSEIDAIGPTRDSGEIENDLPDSTEFAPAAIEQRATTFPSSQPRLIKVETPTLRVWIDRVGGDIVGAHLPKFPVSLDRKDVPTTILDQSPTHTYVAQSGLIGPDGPDDGRDRPIYQTGRESYVINQGKRTIELEFVENGITFIKRFTFDADSYLVEVDYEVQNRTTRTLSYRFFAQLKRDNKIIESNDVMLGMRSFHGVATTTDESRYEKLDFDDLEERFRSSMNGGWIAFLQHYFLSAWVGSPEQNNGYYAERRASGLYVAGFQAPPQTTPPGATGKAGSILYVGPKDQKVLEEIAPNLNLTIDYGFLWWLAAPLFFVLDQIWELVGNWGVAIIILTLLIKGAFLPLSAASYRSMAKMRQVQPQMKRLQERYGGDRQKLGQEMMALYKREGASPFGGCLPMLLQMPVFISLYWVLFESVELRQAPFALWLQDLAAMDPYFVLPILMGASMYATTALNPTMPDPMQQKMMKMMPIVFTVLFLWMPSGLVLYWLVNNILSFAQQYYVTKKTGGKFFGDRLPPSN